MTGLQIGNWQFDKPEVVAEQGVVTAKRPAVAEIGIEILKQGGNAIDAAVAMAFAIDVAEPPMTGIGGCGFMTVSLANGESYIVDFFATAPHGAAPDMYELTADFKPDKLGFTGIKDNANASGPRSVGVPGAVAGPLVALERWGKLSRETVLAPAVKLAREGTEITWYETLNSANHMDILNRNPEAARLYLKNGKPLQVGQEKPNLLKLPELADTLEKISREGAAGFYQGEIAEKIVAELQKGGCPITYDDLANYQAIVREPIKLPYRGTELLLMPGATGGPTIAEIVNILEGWNLAELGNSSPEYLHLLIETCKLVLADRLAYLADEVGQTGEIPWREIASKEFAATRRGFIKERAAGKYEPGDPFNFSTNPASQTGYQSNADSCTTYLSAMDAEGNAVSLTQTLNGYYGSGIAIPGTGIVMNNAMVLFDPRPGQVNSVAPGKRPLSSMAQFIAREPGTGRVLALAGANGGRKITDTVAQVLLNMLDFDRGAQAACAEVYLDPNGEVTLVDKRVGEATLKRLEELGHKISPQTATVWPRLSANPNAIKRQGDQLLGGSEIFTPSAAAGY